MVNRIHIGNLAYSVTDEILKNAFEQFGSVQSAIVVKDKKSGKSKGFGFIEMASEEEAVVAIAKLNETPLEGRTIFVAEAQSTGPIQNSSASHRRGGRERKNFSENRNRRNGGFRGERSGEFRRNNRNERNDKREKY